MQIVPVSDIPKIIEETPTDLMKLFKVFQKMELLCDKESGIGLSAVQVGIPWRLFVVRVLGDCYNCYVDCEYEGLGEKQDSIEGCLSLRDPDGMLQNFQVQRYSEIQVTGKLLFDNGEKLVLEDVNMSVNLENDGIYTVVFQHEIDHHHDVLISDIGDPVQVRSAN